MSGLKASSLLAALLAVALLAAGAAAQDSLLLSAEAASSVVTGNGAVDFVLRIQSLSGKEEPFSVSAGELRCGMKSVAFGGYGESGSVGPGETAYYNYSADTIIPESGACQQDFVLECEGVQQLASAEFVVDKPDIRLEARLCSRPSCSEEPGYFYEGDDIFLSVSGEGSEGFDYALSVSGPYQMREAFSGREHVFSAPAIPGRYTAEVRAQTEFYDAYPASVSFLVVGEKCVPDGACGNDESWVDCPQDCSSGMRDGHCDGQADGICDPDCSRRADIDCRCVVNGYCEDTENNVSCPQDCGPGSPGTGQPAGIWFWLIWAAAIAAFLIYAVYRLGFGPRPGVNE